MVRLLSGLRPMVKRFESTVTRRSLPVASFRASVTSDFMVDFGLWSLDFGLGQRIVILSLSASLFDHSTTSNWQSEIIGRLLPGALGRSFDLSISGKRLHLNAEHPGILTNNR